MRERVGVERLSKSDPFVKKDHQVLRNFEVSTIFNYIQSSLSSNKKKKHLTLLVKNLKQLENRYETSFQLMRKQNQTLMKVVMQLNIHVEKLTQFNKNQHQFYEKELVNNIFMPYQELCRMWTKINNSDKERKELLSFF